MAAMTLLLCQPLAAQDKEKDKDKDKDKEKNKIIDNEEIIIQRKGDKDTKVTIEIKGDDVIVNGKPLADFDDDNVLILKGRPRVYGLTAPHSPFRGQGGTLSFDSHPGFPDNSAFLGVITEKDEKGVKIEEVTDNSSADKAGLKEDDVITKIDDANIETPDDLTKAIRKHKPEDKIIVTYERDGKSNKTEVTLGKRKGKTITYQSPRYDAMPKLNFDWKDSDMGPGTFMYSNKPRIGIKAQDTEDGKGVKVLDVDDESVADKAGIKKDDVITEFDGKKVNNADELAGAAREAKDKTAFKITFNRNGKSQTVEVKTPKKLKTTNL
jgi:serine protease Do